MSRIKQMYHKYMIRPIIYQCISRLVIVITLGMVWVKFVNQRENATLIGYFFPIAGFLLLAIAWFRYLRLDGVTITAVKKEKKPKKRFAFKTMIDHTREDVISFSGMDDRDRMACMLLVNLIDGLLLLLIWLISEILL